VRLPPPALYWVVEPGPLKMSPGLFRLGTDFGNGPIDGSFFQLDSDYEEMVGEKQRILADHPDRLRSLDDPHAAGLLARVRGWMQETLLAQRHLLADAVGRRPQEASLDFRELTLAIQEDFAVLQRTQTGDRLALLSVCFPSGWQPERLLGTDFSFVHDPVPAFDAVSNKREKIVSAMIERGPYVRFVWTVTADARLDHHPIDSPRLPWTPESQGILRVERQVTVPFPEDQGALFLIRTYRYPFAELTPEQRRTLSSAIERMPEDIARYKGLSSAIPVILDQLR